MTTNTSSLQVFDSIKDAWRRVGGVKATLWAGVACIIILRIAMALAQQLIESTALGMLDLILIFVMWMVFSLLFSGLLYLGFLRARDVPIQFSMISYVFRWRNALNFLGMFILKAIFFIPALVIISAPMIHKMIMAGIGAANSGEEEALGHLSEILALGSLDVIIILVGIALFIFLSIRMMYAEIAVVAQQMGPWTAIKYSFKVTKGNVWKLIGLFFMNILILFLSVCTFGILYIWTLPYFLINFGLVYNFLMKSSGEDTSMTPAP